LACFGNAPGLEFFEGVLVVHSDVGTISHNVGMRFAKIAAYCSFFVLIGDCHLEVVVILPCVDLDSWLVGFVSDSIPYSGSKHHLRAPLEVVHHIFKRRLECLLINQVEIN
jgi:hypothetical protein